jgi:hypothetical protein
LTDEDWQLFLAIHGNESVRALMQMSSDERFNAALTDFLHRAHQFSELTGESLDTSKDNIIFFQNPEEDTWRYMLVDALFPSNAGRIDESREIFRRLSHLHPQDLPIPYRQEGFELLNTLGFVRTVNALSEYLHLPRRIELLPKNGRLLDETWSGIATTLRNL